MHSCNLFKIRFVLHANRLSINFFPLFWGRLLFPPISFSFNVISTILLRRYSSVGRARCLYVASIAWYLCVGSWFKFCGHFLGLLYPTYTGWYPEINKLFQPSRLAPIKPIAGTFYFYKQDITFYWIIWVECVIKTIQNFLVSSRRNALVLSGWYLPILTSCFCIMCLGKFFSSWRLWDLLRPNFFSRLLSSIIRDLHSTPQWR